MGQELSSQYYKREEPPTQLMMRSSLQAVKDLSFGTFSYALTALNGSQTPERHLTSVPQHHLTWLFQSLGLGLFFVCKQTLTSHRNSIEG